MAEQRGLTASSTSNMSVHTLAAQSSGRQPQISLGVHWRCTAAGAEASRPLLAVSCRCRARQHTRRRAGADLTDDGPLIRTGGAHVWCPSPRPVVGVNVSVSQRQKESGSRGQTHHAGCIPSLATGCANSHQQGQAPRQQTCSIGCTVRFEQVVSAGDRGPGKGSTSGTHRSTSGRSTRSASSMSCAFRLR